MKIPLLRPAAYSWLIPKHLIRPGQLDIARSSVQGYRRSFHQTPRRREDQDEKRSFRGQLYESTAQRLERERLEDEKYIKIRAARQGNGPQTAALMVCMVSHQHISARC